MFSWNEYKTKFHQTYLKDFSSLVLYILSLYKAYRWCPVFIVPVSLCLKWIINGGLFLWTLQNDEDDYVVPYDADLECKTHVVVYDSNTESTKEESQRFLIFWFIFKNLISHSHSHKFSTDKFYAFCDGWRYFKIISVNNSCVISNYFSGRC